MKSVLNVLLYSSRNDAFIFKNTVAFVGLKTGQEGIGV